MFGVWDIEMTEMKMVGFILEYDLASGEKRSREISIFLL